MLCPLVDCWRRIPVHDLPFHADLLWDILTIMHLEDYAACPRRDA